MIVYELIKTSRHMKTALDQALVEEGITASQFALMNQLGMAEGALSAIELVGRLESDKPTISGIVKRLYDKEIISKHADPKDGRAQLLSLTEKGSQSLDVLREKADLLSDQLLEGISVEEQALMRKILKQINGNMEVER